jgi:hypothetical protein
MKKFNVIIKCIKDQLFDGKRYRMLPKNKLIFVFNLILKNTKNMLARILTIFKKVKDLCTFLSDAIMLNTYSLLITLFKIYKITKKFDFFLFLIYSIFIDPIGSYYKIIVYLSDDIVPDLNNKENDDTSIR